MSTPRLAIVIYSMYGHIAKCTDPTYTSMDLIDTYNTFSSVAEAVKGGAESAGGTAPIYQYVIFVVVQQSPA